MKRARTEEAREDEVRPRLLVTAGPTGAGKSSLMHVAGKELELVDPLAFLIDDYVENDDVYKQDVREILRNRADLERSLSEPSEEILQSFKKAYSKARDEGCNRGGGCNSQLDADVMEAFEVGRDIIFETTGRNYPGWLIQLADEHGYESNIAYTLASVCKLIARNKSRAVKQTLEFLAGNTKSAPRLPDVSQHAYKKSLDEIEKALFYVLRNCVGGGGDCKFPVSRLLIYDSTSFPMELVLSTTGACESSDCKRSENLIKGILLTQQFDKC